MKVKCIDDSGWGEGKLTVGQVYEVIGEGSISYRVYSSLEGMELSPNKTRFVVVNEDEPLDQAEDPCRKGTHAGRSHGMATSKSAMNDMSFFSAVREGYCACNVPKSSCDYHR